VIKSVDGPKHEFGMVIEIRNTKIQYKKNNSTQKRQNQSPNPQLQVAEQAKLA
jgi:hypothetical protein